MKGFFSIGVFGIVLNEQNGILLCLRTDNDKWNLPGGGLEIGEFIKKALTREVYEETGLVTEVQKLVGIYEKEHKLEKVFIYTCQKLEGELTLNDEAKDLKYFPMDQLPTNIIQSHKHRIEHFAQTKGKTMVERVENKNEDSKDSSVKIICNLISLCSSFITGIFAYQTYLGGTELTGVMQGSKKANKALKQCGRMFVSLIELLGKEVNDHCVISNINKN